MKELVEFMGPKLREEELSRIWLMAEKASPHVVDNIHRIMAAAASRFNPHQFDHLLSLIRKVFLFVNSAGRTDISWHLSIIFYLSAYCLSLNYCSSEFLFFPKKKLFTLVPLHVSLL